MSKIIVFIQDSFTVWYLLYGMHVQCRAFTLLLLVFCVIALNHYKHTLLHPDAPRPLLPVRPGRIEDVRFVVATEGFRAVAVGASAHSAPPCATGIDGVETYVRHRRRVGEGVLGVQGTPHNGTSRLCTIHITHHTHHAS